MDTCEKGGIGIAPHRMTRNCGGGARESTGEMKADYCHRKRHVKTMLRAEFGRAIARASSELRGDAVAPAPARSAVTCNSPLFDLRRALITGITQHYQAGVALRPRLSAIRVLPTRCYPCVR
jgi:hypothetical protein